MATARRIARRSPLAGVDDHYGGIIDTDSPQSSSAGIGSSGGGGDDSNAIESPVVIGGIAAASAVLVALTVWLAWVLCRSKRTKRRSSRDDEARPPLPKDWDSVAEHFNRAKSPQPQNKSNVLAQQFAFPHLASSAAARTEQQPPASSFLNTRAKSPQHPIKPNEVGKPQALPHLFSRPLSRDEFRILDHHTQTNTLPQPFTKVQPQDVARIELAVRNRNSTAIHPSPLSQQLPSSAFPPVRNETSPSRSPAPRRIHSIISSKHHSAATVASSASSFSFASMPYRSGIHSLDAVQEDGSISNRSSDADAAGAALSIPRIQPGFHVAKVAFTPLLPDEVELKVGERATVVDVYGDGWCVVLLGVIMGAVPSYCFVEPSTEEPEGFERTRPPRKASLGVTVELETGTDASDADADSDTPLDPPDIPSSIRHPSSRHDSVFSWSNF